MYSETSMGLKIDVYDYRLRVSDYPLSRSIQSNMAIVPQNLVRLENGGLIIEVLDYRGSTVYIYIYIYI